jgi:ankyrin repeat protein
MEALLEALRHDSLPGIRKYLQSNTIDLNKATILCDQYEMDEPDEIPLMFWAIQVGASREAIELLMEYGLDITACNREGLGAIDIAIRHRRIDLVALCAETGVSLTQSRRRSGMTPLMVAASFNNTEMVDYLIARGASVWEQDKRGTTAMEYARMLGLNGMVAYLEKIGESQKEKQGV